MSATTLPAFRGRASESEALDRLLQAARTGRSGALVLRGEAGIGKTELLRHVARQASGFRLCELEGVEAEMELPYAGLHQLCAPMLGAIDAIPDHHQAALRVALGLAAGDPPDRFLVALAALGVLSSTAEERPLLCLIDDAQWLDSATRQVLGFVARRLGAEPLAMVFAVREPSSEAELAHLPELKLAGLDDDDARALLATVAPGPLDERVRDRIVAETRGNPLALLELPRGRSVAELAGGFALPDGKLPRELEEHYVRRLDALPEATRRLALLAAADPVGDAPLLWRAAHGLGIDDSAAGPAAREGLLEIGERARFRHPLIRSAVYRAAADDDRRAAHRALEAATDPEADPDRRAWHRAHAASGVDDEVADELVEGAARAEARGGMAAAAAFLERACALTSDPGRRAARALAAARAKFAAGDAVAAASLLATAEAGPLDELDLAEVQRLRAEIAFDTQRGRDAPPLLLEAARRLEPLDPPLARATYLEALLAAIYAGRLAHDGDVAAIAEAARAAAGDPASAEPRQLLLAGLATRMTDGYVAAAPALRDAVRARRAEEPELGWLTVPYAVAAQDLWDDEAWFELAAQQVELARQTGRLTLLPYALDYLAGHQVQAGALGDAARLVSEASALTQRARAETLPYIPLLLAAWRGEASTAATLARTMTDGAEARGEGCAITVADYAMAVLGNGLGHYEPALAAAQRACEGDEMATSSWALPELVEAAARAGQHALAADAARRIDERARASGTSWARGTAARALALVAADDDAEALHREAVETLSQTRMAAHSARARLTYGEWLRRQARRVDAREQLRAAHEALAAMGADGFADRARRELLATGEKARKRRDDTRDDLTPQELHIAGLAREGKTNAEIGAELFISARTVEWHLRKVFGKLGITSRRGLRSALAGRDEHAPVA
jgi:DNA-binding CsgD family transcriptional regulator